MSAIWRDWLVGKALVLWSTNGFDAGRGLFHERLAWDGSPVAVGELRLMVQARQIATYCRAALDGTCDAAQQALRCLDEVERLYHRADGGPGWIFAVAPGGQPANCARDLYAHGFVLFAYAWALRLTGDARYRRAARATAEEVHHLFAADNGGFGERLPQGATRRQNPHMHLLEAYLALYEASDDGFYLDQAGALVDLALTRLIDPRSGLLGEYFTPNWAPLGPWGTNRVEPGHQFEWAWLLGEYRRLAGATGDDAARLDAAAERLFAGGLGFGCDQAGGAVLDAITEDGTIVERSTRIWPHTELLRLLCQRGAGDAAGLAGRVNERFFTCYAPAHLAGGWIDRLDAAGAPLGEDMPASSLYHIYGAGREMLGLSPDDMITNHVIRR